MRVNAVYYQIDDQMDKVLKDPIKRIDVTSTDTVLEHALHPINPPLRVLRHRIEQFVHNLPPLRLLRDVQDLVLLNTARHIQRDSECAKVNE